ncbi:endonuclease/exonuclease/phosphatase family protein [Lysobacter sp. CA199]|uniref:endonuclease/exonuclease/phosphatase family protein n=1 Tax=Lysobacter sp. CA199 TaxID=3455608 RepID=UPI003F8D0A77
MTPLRSFAGANGPARRLRRIAQAAALFALAGLAMAAPPAKLPRRPITIPTVPVSVLTLNLWHDKGDWPKRRALIVAEIERLKPDFIALQEVLQRPGLRNQAEDLAEAAGYRVRFVSVDPPDAERRYGNAILYHAPATAEAMRKLEPLNDYRTAAHADKVFDAMHTGVDFYATHLHNEREGGDIRRRQIASLLDFIDTSQRNGAVVVAGDFNSDADSPELKALAARYRDAFAQAHPDLAADAARATTLNPAYLPAQRIDHVFYDPKRFDLLEARIVLNQARDGVWASDHFGLFVRLRPTHPLESSAGAGERH